MPEPDDEAIIAELRELGRRIDVGVPADQRTAVRARLAAPVPHRRWPAATRRAARRWWAAVVAALLGIVLVVPPARAAVVDAVGGLLRVAGVEVRTGAAPQVLPGPPSPLPSARGAGLADARRAAAFPVAVPALLGEPEQVVLADPDPGGAPRVVTLVYRGGTVRLDQFDGNLGSGFIKTARDATWTQVGAAQAIWVALPHPLTYVDRAGVEHTEGARSAGPALIWSSGPVTYRLEGLPVMEQARSVAESLR